MTPPYFAVTGSSIHVEEVPSGTTASAILDATYPVTASSFNTVMIVGEDANQSLAALALIDDHSAPPAGQIKLRLVNGASTIGPVDVYINNIGDAFPVTPTIASLAFKSSTAYFPLTAANFHVCLMPAGTAPGVVGHHRGTAGVLVGSDRGHQQRVPEFHIRDFRSTDC